MNRIFTFTRAAALQRLATVAPRLGSAYAAHRNGDAGRDREPTTTALSPFLRRRLILESEVVAAAADMHDPRESAKFVEEVFWRSYFKGHLETHPAVWTNYLDLLAEAQGRLATQSGLHRAVLAATEGRTGIEGFDDWARELVDTGWLHNHARMWFASIWIFTLRLPWVLGADFFMRHLVDGDPASNTLSWRWVAGLHTRGKHYVARAENIRRYTDGRFSPQNLNEDPVSLEEPDLAPLVPLPPADPAPDGKVALLLHLDDLHPESLPLGNARVVRVVGMPVSVPGATDRVCRADEDAMADGVARAAAHFGCASGPAEPGMPVVAAWAPVGFSASALPPGCVRVRRDWDEATWPRATRGYFQLKTAIPAILRGLAAE